MNNKYLAFVGVAIVAFVLGFIIAPEKGQTPNVISNNDTDIKSDILSINPKEIRDVSGKLYRIMAEYPQFSLVGDEFNGAIAKEVGDRVKEFKNAVEENWKARQDTTPKGEVKEEFPVEPFYFSAVWESKQMNERYISFVLHFDSFEGGANGRQELRTFNYDLKNKKQMTLADLFSGVPDYLKKIASFSKQYLVGSLGESGLDMIETGTKSTSENFKNFVFSDDIVLVYFEKYQVAPGAAGEQKIFIPRGAIK
jgi:hypothetical protein